VSRLYTEPLQIVHFDQKTKPELGSTGAIDVIGKGAVAILASCDFDFGSPAALVANQRKMPGMSTCAGDPKFGAQGIGPYAYSMADTTNIEGGALAEFAYNTKKWRTAYVIATAHPWEMPRSGKRSRPSVSTTVSRSVTHDSNDTLSSSRSDRPFPRSS